MNRNDTPYMILCVRLSAAGSVFWAEEVVDIEGGLSITAPSSEPSDMPSLEEMQLEKVVFIDTMKCVLIPSEVYTDGEAQEYLTLNNISVEQNEEVCVSQPIHGTVAVMVCNRESMARLREHLGEFAVASPMQYNLMRAALNEDLARPLGRSYRKYAKRNRGKFTLIYSTPHHAYLSVFDRRDELIFPRSMSIAEVVPLDSSVDMLYYLNWLDSRFDIRRLPIYVKGVGAENILRSVERKFKKSICE